MSKNNLAEQLDDTAMQLGATDRIERKAIIKEALREAIKEWADERYKEVGKWTARGLWLAFVSALIVFILIHSGWARL